MALVITEIRGMFAVAFRYFCDEQFRIAIHNV